MSHADAGGGLRLVFVGDLILAGEWARDGQPHSVDPFRRLRSELQADLLVANLETTVDAGAGRIDKEPRLITTEAILERALRELHADVVSMANNHAFDALPEGFRATTATCDRLGVRWFGAGEDAQQAARPLKTEHGAIRLGWLGYTAADTKPSHVASAETPGVNLLDPDRILNDVTTLAPTVDHVIVSLHWGVEYCHLPSPDQIKTARRIIAAGATLVVGHHAHVVQGVERHDGKLIAYNLGNLTSTDLFVDGRRAVRATPRTRSSLALEVSLSAQAIEQVGIRPLHATPQGFAVDDPVARRYFAVAERGLRRGVSTARWRRRRIYEDVLVRSARKLHPSVIRSVTPAHLAKVVRNAVRAARGRGPA